MIGQVFSAKFSSSVCLLSKFPKEHLPFKKQFRKFVQWHLANEWCGLCHICILVCLKKKAISVVWKKTLQCSPWSEPTNRTIDVKAPLIVNTISPVTLMRFCTKFSKNRGPGHFFRNNIIMVSLQTTENVILQNLWCHPLIYPHIIDYLWVLDNQETTPRDTTGLYVNTVVVFCFVATYWSGRHCLFSNCFHRNHFDNIVICESFQIHERKTLCV